MGAPSEAQVMGFGRLISGPTTADSATNYGGTVLGAIGAAVLRPRLRHDPRTSGSRGGQVTDSTFLSQDADLFVVFQSYDSAALGVSFYDTDGTLIKLPGTKKPGTWLSDESSALLLVADDAARAPSFYLPRAVPLQDRLDLDFGGYMPTAFAMRFLALPPASGDLAQIGLIADLTTGWTS